MRRIYELVLLLSPQVDEKEHKQVVDELLKLAGKNAEAETVGLWKKRPLAYPIKGHDEAFYLFVQLKLEPEMVSKIGSKLRFNERVLRHLFVRMKAKKEKIKKGDILKEKKSVKPKKPSQKAKKKKVTKKKQTKETKNKD